MPLSEDQEKVKVLLSEAITVLCRNGLNYRNEFTIEGLLGITLDSEDVFLVNINERVKSKTKDSTQREVDIVQSTEDNSCKRKRRFSGRSNGDRGSGIQSEPEAKKQRSSTSVDAIQISDGDDSRSGGLLPAQIDVMAEGKMLALHLMEDGNQTNIIHPPDHVDDKPDMGAKVIVKQEPGHSVQLDKLSAIKDMSGTGTDQHQMTQGDKKVQRQRDSPTQKETTQNTNTENNIFKCPYCPATYSDEKSFMAHTRKHEGRPYACSLCDKTYTVVTALTKHMQHHTGNYKFKCSVCDKGYTSQEHYEGHMMKHQGKKYVCEYENCTKQFGTALSLKYHQREHTGIYPLHCSICNKGFSLKKDLRRHEETHDKGIGPTCWTCHKVFSSEKQLRIHKTDSGHSGR